MKWRCESHGVGIDIGIGWLRRANLGLAHRDLGSDKALQGSGVPEAQHANIWRPACAPCHGVVVGGGTGSKAQQPTFQKGKRTQHEPCVAIGQIDAEAYMVCGEWDDRHAKEGVHTPVGCECSNAGALSGWRFPTLEYMVLLLCGRGPDHMVTLPQCFPNGRGLTIYN